MQQGGLHSLLRSLRVLYFCSPNCNIGYLNNVLISVTISWCHSRGIFRDVVAEASEKIWKKKQITWSGFRGSLCASTAVREISLLGKQRSQCLKLTSLVVWRKTTLSMMIFLCVWPHGFKYHHFDKLVPSFNSQRFPSVKFSSLEISDWIQNIIFLNWNAMEWEKCF